MPKLVARCIAISLDGFSAAKGHALDAPFGKDGLRLMERAFITKFFAEMSGREGGAEGLDNDFLVHSFDIGQCGGPFAASLKLPIRASAAETALA